MIRVVVKWRLCSMLFLYPGFSVLLLWRFSRTALFIFFVLFAHLQSWCSSFLALRHSGVAALFVFCCFGSRFSSIHTAVFYPLLACACDVDDLPPVWRSTASVCYRFLACVLAVHCAGPLGGRLLLYCCNVLVLRGSILLSFVRRSGVPRRWLCQQCRIPHHACPHSAASHLASGWPLASRHTGPHERHRHKAVHILHDIKVVLYLRSVRLFKSCAKKSGRVSLASAH